MILGVLVWSMPPSGLSVALLLPPPPRPEVLGVVVPAPAGGFVGRVACPLGGWVGAVARGTPAGAPVLGTF